MKYCMTIAGSDCSGGAGIQADMKTFAAHGVYGMSTITAVVAENTTEVRSVHAIPTQSIKDQLDCNFNDFPIDAIKIGMLSDANTIKVVARCLATYQPTHLVLDPVMVATSGGSLMQQEAVGCLVKELLPMATVLTPNLQEAEVLVGYEVTGIKEMEQAAKQLVNMGVKAALVKGGHLAGQAVDVLYDGEKMHHFSAQRVDSTSTHGTGCTLSSAIAANLALGHTVSDACGLAKEYITKAITTATPIGRGCGPVNHHHEFYQLKGWL